MKDIQITNKLAFFRAESLNFSSVRVACVNSRLIIALTSNRDDLELNSFDDDINDKKDDTVGT